ncbi:MAG: twin-arginine translocation signal domain-containing protein, partial [Nocardioidaceae bacterium]
MSAGNPWTRREFLRVTGLVGAGVALGGCASEPQGPGAGGAAPPGAEPSPVFSEPSTKLSGSLSLLLWSHFVPSHDTWFDKFAQDWGKKVGVNVRVDHIDVANVPTQIASEIQAG